MARASQSKEAVAETQGTNGTMSPAPYKMAPMNWESEMMEDT